MTNEERSAELERSWEANAAAWTATVRRQLIESRRVATDRAVLEAVLALQPENVLDVGCGEGWLCRALRAAGVSTAGVDGSRSLIRAAREADPAGKYVELRYEEFEGLARLAGSGFDVAVFNFSLFQEDVGPIIASVAGVLRQGGALVIQTVPSSGPGCDSTDGWRTETFARAEQSFPAPMPWYFRNRETWLDVLERAGMATSSVTEPRHPETGAPLSLLIVANRRDAASGAADDAASSRGSPQARNVARQASAGVARQRRAGANTTLSHGATMVRKAVVEAIGTFFLVLTIGQVVIEPGAGAFAPLAIGSALMVMIFAGGHVSGGHYNPAVSLGVFLRGRASAAEMLAYWGAQVAGAALATFAVRILKGAVVVAPISPPVGAAFLAEFLFTFALVYVVLNVATARGNEGNSHYGLAIGFTVMVGAYSVGAISGGAFNPAVAIGITMLGITAPASLWLYLAANLLGGAAAAMLFNALDLGADKPTAATPAQQAGLKAPGEPSPT